MAYLRLFVVISALFVPRGIEAQRSVGDTCSFQSGASGECKLLMQCPSVYQDLLGGKPPELLCGFSGYEPIICCPDATSATLTTRDAGDTTTTTTTERPTRRIVTRRPSRPRTPKPTIEKRFPGDLAREKCAEYAKSVYVLKPSPVLSIDEQFVNVSLCGFKSKQLIVGGTRAAPREFPHMASVGYNSRNQGILWLCGGTLVSENFVLTAAHCTYSLDYGNAVWVRVGDLNLVHGNDEANPQERAITERIRHPSYKKPSEYHDIALLRMDRPVVFDAFARPACLPAPSRSDVSEGIATGWGRVDWTDDEGSSDLLKVTLRIIDESSCNSKFIGGSVDFKLKRGVVGEWQICAGGDGRDTCQGDSGGPLAIYDSDHECMYDVVGITSIGRICGSIAPGLYTRVSNYINWLESTIWQA